MTDDTPLIPATPPPPDHLDRWDILRFVLFFILFLVLSLLVVIAIAAASGSLPASGKIGDLPARQVGWILVGVSVAIYLSVGASVWFAVARRGRNPMFSLALRPVPWWIALLSGVGLIVVSILVGYLANLLFETAESRVTDLLGNMSFSTPMIVAAAAVIGVGGPIAEELLFRGLLFGWLRRHWPYWPTALVTSALFGLAHGSLSYAFVAGILGLVLAYLRERTDSLWTPIVAHSMNNLFVVGVALLATDLM